MRTNRRDPGRGPGERDSNQGPVERERHSRAPVLLVEAEVRQGRGSGWVPTHSWRRPACRDGSDGGICRIPRKNEGCPDR